jgi:hypothetical protein
MAVLADTGASVIVVANALRLLRARVRPLRLCDLRRNARECNRRCGLDRRRSVS